VKREICAKEECYEPVSPNDDLLCEKHLQEWLTEKPEGCNGGGCAKRDEA
jgi:hypothetical protein